MTALSNSEKVLHYLKEQTSIDLTHSRGRTTAQMSQICQIERTQMSKLLNQLVGAGKVCKIKGRPVHYYYLSEEYQLSQFEFESEKELIDQLSESLKAKKTRSLQAFDYLIGAQDSLKTQMKLAKAAILYPPAGLNTLILGPTGVGKSLFAEVMYRYAIEIGRLAESSPLVVLNCADYAGNPQLLLSLLFGYRQGAFTGATQEKDGLIKEADGGILFLDEIHRLPAEGQEMLFSLIDRGKYRRLGDTKETCEARVMLIGATTEVISDSLLGTFLRRIPNKITLPTLEERSSRERLALLDLFLLKESDKVQLPIEVSAFVVSFFLAYTCQGNIGQLKNDLKMLCATTYAEAVLTDQTQIIIDKTRLIEEYGELYQIAEIVKEYQNRNEVAEDRRYYRGVLFADKDLKDQGLSDYYHAKEEEFYQKLLNKYTTQVTENRQTLQLKSEIQAELETFFNLSLTTDSRDNQAIGKVVSQQVLSVLTHFFDSCEYQALQVDQKMLNSLALHIETLLIKLKKGMTVSSQVNFNDINAQDYQLAEKLKRQLEDEFDVLIPYQEVVVMAVFLTAVSERRKGERIGILVIMHGDNVASGMAKVANDLLEAENTHFINMRLTDNVSAIYEKASKKVREIDRGKGVLLLVDMGSLVFFAEKIATETGIDVQYLTMVNTPMVIEAARKSQYTNLTLNQLIEEIIMESQYIGHRQISGSEEQDDYFEIFDNRVFSQYERMRLIGLVKQSAVFVNAGKACQQLAKYLAAIHQGVPLTIEKNLLIKFVLHGVSMIERAIANEQIHLSQFSCQNLRLFSVLKEQIWVLEESFNCQFSEGELYYLEEFIAPYVSMHTIS